MVIASTITSQTAFAENINCADAVVSETTNNDLIEYLDETIPQYLLASEAFEKSEYSYSDPIPVYDIETCNAIGKCVFVFDEDQIVGKLEIRDNGGELASVFDMAVTNEIQNSYEKNYDVALGYYNGNVYLYSNENGFSYIDGRSEPEAISENFSVELASVEPKHNTDLSFPVAFSTSVESKYLSVDHVHNQQTSSGNYICWAACVAMTANYI